MLKMINYLNSILKSLPSTMILNCFRENIFQNISFLINGESRWKLSFKLWINIVLKSLKGLVVGQKWIQLSFSSLFTLFIICLDGHMILSFHLIKSISLSLIPLVMESGRWEIIIPSIIIIIIHELLSWVTHTTTAHALWIC